MAKRRKDEFINRAYGEVTMSLANTLTFSAIQMAVGLFQGMAMIIHKIHYYPDEVACSELSASADLWAGALTTSNRLTAIWDVSEPAILDRVSQRASGTVEEVYDYPMVRDMSTLPGGGMITPANPLFVGMTSTGFANPASLRIMIDFTFIELADRDYLELLQSQFPANI